MIALIKPFSISVILHLQSWLKVPKWKGEHKILSLAFQIKFIPNYFKCCNSWLHYDTYLVHILYCYKSTEFIVHINIILDRDIISMYLR